MIEISQGFKTFWAYFKTLLENYFKPSIISWRISLGEIKEFEILLSCPYSALCKLACKRLFYKIRFNHYGLPFSNHNWLCFPNHYFINYYFTILEGIEFKPYFYYFVQTSPSCFVHNVLLKIPLLPENLFYYWLRIMCTPFKIFWKKFDLNWSIFAKSMEEIRKIKKEKKKKEIKTRKGPRGTHFGPEEDPARSPGSRTRKGISASSPPRRHVGPARQSSPSSSHYSRTDTAGEISSSSSFLFTPLP
jgi:hypothetical protein